MCTLFQNETAEVPLQGMLRHDSAYTLRRNLVYVCRDIYTNRLLALQHKGGLGPTSNY